MFHSWDILWYFILFSYSSDTLCFLFYFLLYCIIFSQMYSILCKHSVLFYFIFTHYSIRFLTYVFVFCSSNQSRTLKLIHYIDLAVMWTWQPSEHKDTDFLISFCFTLKLKDLQSVNVGLFDQYFRVVGEFVVTEITTRTIFCSNARD